MINRLKSKIGLSILLVCFALVELSNFESLFYKFMLAFRPDWGAFNHVAGFFLSFALLSGIIVYGLRREKYISWGLALLAIVISLGVYSQIEAITWTWGSWRMENLAVIILAVICPLMVAHTTHQIAREEEEPEAEDEFEIEANIRRQARKLKQKRHVSTAPPPPQNITPPVVPQSQMPPPPPAPPPVNGTKKPFYEFDIENFQ